ncbi:MAG: hypothetical protein WD249_13020 [Gaiellaceae bacterium]
MPELEFWFTEHDAIVWHFDRHPEIGEEVVLGDRGVYRVTDVKERRGVSTADAEYVVERVRDTTYDDLKAMYERGVNRLPPRPGS